MGWLRRAYEFLGFAGNLHFAWFTLGVGAVVGAAAGGIAQIATELPVWSVIVIVVGSALLAAGLAAVAARFVLALWQNRQAAEPTEEAGYRAMFEREKQHSQSLEQLMTRLIERHDVKVQSSPADEHGDREVRFVDAESRVVGEATVSGTGNVVVRAPTISARAVAYPPTVKTEDHVEPDAGDDT